MNSIIEFLNDLNSDDWKYRKSLSFQIASDIKNNNDKIEKILIELLQVLRDGTSDQKYWITQILIENNTFFWSMFLFKEIEKNHKEKEYCKNIVEILKKHNLETEYLIFKFNSCNDSVKSYILDILSVHDLTEFTDFIIGIFKEKYNLLRVKGIELIKKNISPQKYTDFYYLLNDDDISVVKRYTELFYSEFDLSWDLNEELFKKMLLSDEIQGNKILFCNRIWNLGNYESVLYNLEKLSNMDIFYFIYELSIEDLKIFKKNLKATSLDKIYFFLILVLLIKKIKIDIFEIIPIIKEEKEIIIEMLSELMIYMDKINKDKIDGFFKKFKHNNIVLKNILKIYVRHDIKSDNIIKILLKDFKRSNRERKVLYINFLTSIKDESVISFLINSFDDDDWVIRKRCADAVINLDYDNSYVENYLNSENSNIKFWSSYVYINNLSEISFNSAKDIFEKFESEDIKKLVIRKIARMDDTVSFKFLSYVFGEYKKFKNEILKNMIFMSSNSDNVLSFLKEINNNDPETEQLVQNLRDKFEKNKS